MVGAFSDCWRSMVSILVLLGERENDRNAEDVRITLAMDTMGAYGNSLLLRVLSASFMDSDMGRLVPASILSYINNLVLVAF
jgi:hypothetical protein